MKHSLFVRTGYGLLLAGLLSSAVAGQVLIQGVVVDAQQTPLANANVRVLNSYDGTSTETDGTFKFNTNQQGIITVVAQSIGYADQQLTLQPGETIRPLRLVLAERSQMLDAVTVLTKKTNFLATQGLNSLRPLEIRAMGGANADIGNAIRALPGVQATSDATGLFVRGGSADETRVYVDGLTVNNFFYTGSPDVSQRSRYAPELFKGTSFSTGGYSALYGQAMSSALILESNTVASRSTVGGSIGTTGGNFDYNRVLRADRASVGVQLNYTNLGPYYNTIPQRRSFGRSPEQVDLLMNGKYKLSNGGLIKVLFSLGTNKLQFKDQSFARPTQYGLLSRNAYTNVTYTGSMGAYWTINAGAAITLTHNRYSRDSLLSASDTDWTSNTRTLDLNTYTSRLVARRPLGGSADLYIGAEHTATSISSVYAQQDGRSYRLRADDQYGAFFVESNISLSRSLQLRAGLRAEASSLVRDAALSPRLTLTYALRKHLNLTGSFGQFYQEPTADYLLQQAGKLSFQRATHFILSGQYANVNKLFRVEFYQKQYSHLLRTTPDTSTTGMGYARGFDIMWKEDGRIKNVNYWVSYSYLDTKRQYLSYPSLARPGFAAPHTLNMVVNVLLPTVPLNIGLTYVAASGRSYYNPNQSETKFMTNYTPAYHNVGLTVAYLSHFFRANSTLAFSVSNLLGSQQIFGYRYNSPTERVAITPLATRFFYLGLFLNWGTAGRAKTTTPFLPN
ncbi:TonB-dependent receptor [Spirosoma pollinicola]|uniref:TonB-dependent receptor plug domain-containing protein n=1 Tax=Spirosoma pollinicola TaxID=2057025 RepID=A0A2K8Z3J9_9BACT|nr:TonB-dependent receptor [Spirosoma pollinicola]AUD04438.1 hypothetical protein CWM47_22880 [Spirosoma pollinicola]